MGIAGLDFRRDHDKWWTPCGYRGYFLWIPLRLPNALVDTVDTFGPDLSYYPYIERVSVKGISSIVNHNGLFGTRGIHTFFELKFDRTEMRQNQCVF
jgi:hypothetical protein